MQRVEYIRRQPGIGDYNTLVDVINWLLEKAQRKKETVPINICRKVKDYKFFCGVEVQLPYITDLVIANIDEACEVLKQYAFTFQEAKKINDTISADNVVALHIEVEEEITERDKKQEAMFEMVENVEIKEETKEETKEEKKEAKKKKAKIKSKWK